MQKKVLATAIAAAMCAPFAAEAVSVKFSGHVHRVIKVLDDGQASEVPVVFEQKNQEYRRQTDT